MRAQTLLLAATAAALTGFAPAPFPKPDRRGDLEKMRGKWAIVYHEERGDVREDGKGAVIEITGNRLTIRIDGADGRAKS